MVKIKIKNEEKVRLAIAQSGYSLRGFSKRIGISHSYLYQVLKGLRNPSAPVASKMASELGLKTGDVFLYSIGNKSDTKDDEREVIT